MKHQTSNSDEHSLPVEYEGYDEPEHDPPHGLGQLGGVGPHVADDEMEGEYVVADAVAAVQEDAIHAGVEKRLTLPQLLDVNDEVEEREEDEGEAGGDKDEGE